jgi:multiple sugar transport system ATP-binding protein
MTMADQIVVMRDGIVEQRGGPLDLYDHPVNLFVAGFIGSPAMNFLPGTLKRVGSGLQVYFADGSAVAAPGRASGQDGQSVIYGVRPEHLMLGSGGNGIKTSVIVVEPTGADTQVFSKFAGIEITGVFRERHDFAAGDVVYLVPDGDKAHLFVAASGKSLMSWLDK